MNKKPILIQVAMEVEAQVLLNKINNLEEFEIKGYKYYKGLFHDYPIVISLSKVGLINASTSLTIAVNEFNPKAIINMGIAGATSKNIHTKDIVIGESCININSYRTSYLKEGEGSNPNKWELLTFISGETDRLVIEKASEKLIELTKEISNEEYGNLYYGRIGSGDIWNNEMDRLLFLNEKYEILCEDMESIATYTLANQWNIPVISLKMISDNSLTGEEYNRDVGKYIGEYTIKYLERLITKTKNKDHFFCNL